MHSRVQTTLDYVRQEMRFCEQSAREAQLELNRFNSNNQMGQRTNRTGRQAGAGYESAEEGMPQPLLGNGIPVQTECPGCCIPGPPGPRGAAGQPGTNLLHFHGG